MVEKGGVNMPREGLCRNWMNEFSEWISLSVYHIELFLDFWIVRETMIGSERWTGLKSSCPLDLAILRLVIC